MMVMPNVLALQPLGSAGLIARPGALLVLLVLVVLVARIVGLSS